MITQEEDRDPPPRYSGGGIDGRRGRAEVLLIEDDGKSIGKYGNANRNGNSNGNGNGNCK